MWEIRRRAYPDEHSYTKLEQLCLLQHPTWLFRFLAANQKQLLACVMLAVPPHVCKVVPAARRFTQTPAAPVRVALVAVLQVAQNGVLLVV
jgi:hypothetical protein